MLLDDPAADLFGNEPVLALVGAWAGYVRGAAYGYTVGGAVGLAQVACDDGVTGQWLKEGGFRVRTPDGRSPPGCRSRRRTTRSGCASWTAEGRAAFGDESGTDLRGPVSTDELGPTYMHEHIFTLTADMQQNYPQEWGSEEARVADAARPPGRAG